MIFNHIFNLKLSKGGSGHYQPPHWSTYLLNVLSISEHAHPHLRAGDMWQLHGSTETFVFLGVIVLQTNLKFNRLGELPVLLLGISDNCGDGFPQNITLKLTAFVHPSKPITLVFQSHIQQHSHPKPTTKKSHVLLKILTERPQKLNQRGLGTSKKTI